MNSHRGYYSVFGNEESSSTPAFDSADQSYARFPLSRPMSPPVRSKYVASPPPRANSTPPANHSTNNQQQKQIEDYEYAQLLMGMKQVNMNDQVNSPLFIYILLLNCY